jgi:hypothetical protein
MSEPSEHLEEIMLQMPFPVVPTICVYCTGKIQGGQDRAFEF